MVLTALCLTSVVSNAVTFVTGATAVKNGFPNYDDQSYRTYTQIGDSITSSPGDSQEALVLLDNVPTASGDFQKLSQPPQPFSLTFAGGNGVFTLGTGPVMLTLTTTFTPNPGENALYIMLNDQEPPASALRGVKLTIDQVNGSPTNFVLNNTYSTTKPYDPANEYGVLYDFGDINTLAISGTYSFYGSPIASGFDLSAEVGTGIYSVPEPSTYILVLAGALLLVTTRKRKMV